MTQVINVRALYAAGLNKSAVDQLIDLDKAAERAASTSVYAESEPLSYYWRTDPSGTYLAGDPTFDITTTFYNQAGTQVAQRVLRGTLTSSTGAIGVTNVSSSASAGYSTAYALTNDDSDSVLATITLTLPDASTISRSVSWTSADHSSAGGSPSSGGDK